MKLNTPKNLLAKTIIVMAGKTKNKTLQLALCAANHALQAQSFVIISQKDSRISFSVSELDVHINTEFAINYLFYIYERSDKNISFEVFVNQVAAIAADRHLLNQKKL